MAPPSISAIVPARPLSMKKFRIGDSDAGITATVKAMQDVTFGREGVGSPTVRAAALDAVRGLQRGMDEITAVFQWVKTNIEFRGEYAETIQTPVATLTLGAGDCDDHSTLIAAMLESIGFETRFQTIATGRDGEFSHVYAEVRLPRSDEWFAVDTTVRSSYPGWQPRANRRKIRAVNPPALRGGGIAHDLFWLALGIVASNYLLKGKR